MKVVTSQCALAALLLLLPPATHSITTQEGVEFYINLPGTREQHVTSADIVERQPFKLVCRYSGLNCEALWLFPTIQHPYAMLNKGSKSGTIGPDYTGLVGSKFNVSFESLPSLLRIEMDVFEASSQMFNNAQKLHYCGCMNLPQSQQKIVSLTIHQPTKPRDLVLRQEPPPPYHEGDRVTLSCAATAWPEATEFTLKANYVKDLSVAEARATAGVSHVISAVDRFAHKSVECWASNTQGTARQQYNMDIYVTAGFFDCYNVEAPLGTTAVLVWNFEVYPEPTSVSLRRQGTPRGEENLGSLLSKGDNRFMLMKEITVGSSTDYGNYTLTVTNEAGAVSHSILLNQTVSPLLPADVSFVPVHQGSALLKWRVRAEATGGGQPEYFLLRVKNRRDPNEAPFTKRKDAVEGKDLYWEEFNNLDYYGSYTAQIKACNALCTDWSFEAQANFSMTALQTAEQAGGSTKSSVILVAFFICLTIVCVLIVAATVYILRRKCKEKSRKDAMYERNVYTNSRDGLESFSPPSGTVTRIPPPPSRSYTGLRSPPPPPGHQYQSLPYQRPPTYQPIFVVDENDIQPKEYSTLPPDFQDFGMQTQSDPDLWAHIARQQQKQAARANLSEPPQAEIGAPMAKVDEEDEDDHLDRRVSSRVGIA